MPSVVEQTPYNEYVANGVTTVFPYEFELLDAGDLAVTVDGVSIPTSDFTLTGVGDQDGGDVTFDVAPANGAKVLLAREIALARDTDYQYNGPLDESAIDRDLNRLWQALQGLWARLTGAVRAPFPEQLDELPAAADRALQLLGFDADGQPIAVAPTSGSAADLALRLADPSSASNGPALIGFNPELNYVAGTIGAEFRLTVTPQMFGASDDDETEDNYAAINSAVLFLAAQGGGVLHFRLYPDKAVYLIRYAIPIRSNIHYKGDRGVVLKAHASSWDNIIGVGNNLLEASIAARAAGGTVTRLGKPDFLTNYTEEEAFINGGYNGYARTNVKFTDIIFDGNKANCTENQLNLVGAATGTFLSGENVTSSSGGTARLAYVYSGTVSLEPKSISGTFNVGNTVTGVTSGATMTIGSKQADDAFQLGLRLMNVSHFVVRDCTFRNMVFIPLSIYDNCNNGLVEKNFFHDNNKSGTVNTAAWINIYIEYFTQSITVRDNVIVGGLGYSIVVTGVGGAHRDVKLLGNTIYNAASDAIRISNDSGSESIYGTVVDGNTITGCLGVGAVAIRLNHGGGAGAISESMVTNNAIRDATNGILFQGRVSDSQASGNTLRTITTTALDTTNASLTGNMSWGNKTDSGALTEAAETFYGTTYVKGGTTQLKGAKSISVSTTTTIYTLSNANYQTLFVVSGDTGAAGFMDLVLYAFGTITAISSNTAYGAPAARTYSRSGTAVQLAMAAGTYNCKVTALENQ